MKKTGYVPYCKNEKIRIAVMFQVASYWPSIESFYQACIDDNEIDIRIFYVDDLAVEKAQIEGTAQFLQERALPYEIYSEEKIDVFQPHAALYQPPYDVLYRNPSALSMHLMNKGVRIIYIPYGIELADTEDARLAHFHAYVVRNSWRIYTFSYIMKEDYQKYCPNRHAVRATGSPKFDAVYNKPALRQEVCNRAKGRKIVVWKMHFPKLIYEGAKRLQVTPYLTEYFRFAERISDFEELFFVVMPHPLFFSNAIPGRFAEDIHGLFKILREKSNVFIDQSSDYRHSLCNADAVITDRSALMLEAGLCKVPVLYMSNEDYDEPLTKAVKYIVDTYEQGKTAADMEEFIDKFRFNLFKDYMKKRNSIIEKTMPFLDGACGKRIAEDIKAGIKEEKEGKIKLVLFGAGAVCRHYVNELDIQNDSRFEVVGLADNDSEKWGMIYSGMRVMSPENLKEINFDILVITAEQYHMPIKKKLVYELYLDEDKIMRLDVFCEKYVKTK